MVLMVPPSPQLIQRGLSASNRYWTLICVRPVLGSKENGYFMGLKANRVRVNSD